MLHTADGRVGFMDITVLSKLECVFVRIPDQFCSTSKTFEQTEVARCCSTGMLLQSRKGLVTARSRAVHAILPLDFPN